MRSLRSRGLLRLALVVGVLCSLAAVSFAQGTTPPVMPAEIDYSAGFNLLLARVGTTVGIAALFILPIWAVRHGPEIVMKLAGRAAR